MACLFLNLVYSLYRKLQQCTISIAATKTINFRAPAAKQALIDRAAALSGKSRTEFILDSSCERAREVLADQTHFALSRDVMQRFNTLIEAPLAEPEALRRLLSTPAPWER